MSTTQPPAGRAPGGGAAARPGRHHLGPAPAAITTARRDLPDKATPVPAAIAREHTASRLSPRRPRPAHPGAMHHRRHEPAPGQPAPGTDNMSQPAHPARALSARGWPAPAPPAHPQHRSPAAGGSPQPARHRSSR
jgi:hypothetical protein